MSKVYTHPDNHEWEQQGDAELVFVGLRYTGNRSIENTPALKTRGAWQGPTRWNPGQVRFGLVPDWANADAVEQGRNVANIEAMGNFDVIYDPAEIAEILLDKNYLPTNVFGQGHDRYVRRKVFEHMGIEDEGIIYYDDDTPDAEEPYLAQLRAIAGVDPEDAAEAAEDTSRSEGSRIAADYPRSDVATAADILGYEGDIDTASKTDLAEYVAGYSKEIATAALRGESVDLSGDEPEVVDAEEPQSIEDLNRPELQELYDELGGAGADPESDDVNRNKNDDLRAGIRRLRGEE
jgi:hypothetical protein